jgi:hypothetical protein
VGLKIERECEWCGSRESVDLGKGGALDLSKIPLPSGWVSKASFPGGRVGSLDGQELCGSCQAEYDGVLAAADKARDEVYTQAMQRARVRAGTAEKAQSGQKKLQSSSFNR